MELIISTVTKAYTLKSNYLCFGRRKPDVDGEIISVIQKNSTPITAADVSANFWCIPKEKVNQVLISTDSIVNVLKSIIITPLICHLVGLTK